MLHFEPTMLVELKTEMAYVRDGCFHVKGVALCSLDSDTAEISTPPSAGAAAW